MPSPDLLSKAPNIYLQTTLDLIKHYKDPSQTAWSSQQSH